MWIFLSFPNKKIEKNQDFFSTPKPTSAVNVTASPPYGLTQSPLCLAVKEPEEQLTWEQLSKLASNSALDWSQRRPRWAVFVRCIPTVKQGQRQRRSTGDSGDKDKRQRVHSEWERRNVGKTESLAPPQPAAPPARRLQAESMIAQHKRRYNPHSGTPWKRRRNLEGMSENTDSM